MSRFSTASARSSELLFTAQSLSATLSHQIRNCRCSQEVQWGSIKRPIYSDISWYVIGPGRDNSFRTLHHATDNSWSLYVCLSRPTCKSFVRQLYIRATPQYENWSVKVLRCTVVVTVICRSGDARVCSLHRCCCCGVESRMMKTTRHEGNSPYNGHTDNTHTHTDTLA